MKNVSKGLSVQMIKEFNSDMKNMNMNALKLLLLTATMDSYYVDRLTKNDIEYFEKNFLS